MNKFRKIFILLLGVMASVQMLAQDKSLIPTSRMPEHPAR